jgi:hypothetical protein
MKKILVTIVVCLKDEIESIDSCVAGFTEHDTFRRNQIREGQLTIDKALDLVTDENRPRYQNIRWYLDTLGLGCY